MNDVRSIFFFSSRRRHTRYIGDWSSDVCSSDLAPPREEFEVLQNLISLKDTANSTQRAQAVAWAKNNFGKLAANLRQELADALLQRSEERRVGKECRARGSPDREEERRRRSGWW